MKIIFLDIDGVLNCSSRIKELTPGGVRGIEDSLLENFARLVRQTGAVIVLTSDWKVGWSHDLDRCSEDAKYLDAKMRKHGLGIIGKTYDDCIFDEYYMCRGAGIRQFLQLREDVEEYVVLDDHDFLDFDEEIHNHFVKTNSLDGFTEEKLELALQILNGDMEEYSKKSVGDVPTL